jgi:glycosyltransferase involved in cell wall biosynthesis
MCESSITYEMNQPLLHVMIPAYGKSPYLRQTLESAVKHLPSDVPITVIEDPSEEADLEKLVSEFPRVEFYRNPTRLGIAGNFNQSIKKSTGIFTQICGSDDVFISNPLNNLPIELLNDKSISTLALDVKIIGDNDYEIKALPDLIKKVIRPKINNFRLFENEKIFNNLMVGDWLYFPAILWRTQTIMDLKFSGEFHTAMDLDVLIRLLAKDYKIAFVKNKVLAYRRHNQSASSLYAKSIGRIDEEIACHKQAKELAILKNWKTGAILAQLAPTVRLHALMRSVTLVFTSPLSALKVLVKAISPIR